MYKNIRKVELMRICCSTKLWPFDPLVSFTVFGKVHKMPIIAGNDALGGRLPSTNCILTFLSLPPQLGLNLFPTQEVMQVGIVMP